MRRYLQIIVSCLLFASCDQGPTTPPDVTFPETNVSFNLHVKPVLLRNCAISGCHDIYSTDLLPRRPVMESHIDMLNWPGLVRPGDSTGSVLAQVLRGQLPHPNDPYFLALTAGQRYGIIRWIFEGARNN